MLNYIIAGTFHPPDILTVKSTVSKYKETGNVVTFQNDKYREGHTKRRFATVRHEDCHNRRVMRSRIFCTGMNLVVDWCLILGISGEEIQNTNCGAPVVIIILFRRSNMG